MKTVIRRGKKRSFLRSKIGVYGPKVQFTVTAHKRLVVRCDIKKPLSRVTHSKFITNDRDVDTYEL